MSARGRSTARRDAAAAAALLGELAMPAAEVTRRAGLALDAAYWRRLVPGLPVLRPRSPRLPARPFDVARAASDLAAHGYARLDRLFDARVTRRLVRAVDRLCAHDWPAVFVVVYDDFWKLPRSGRVPALLAAALGSRGHQSANVWLHQVDARAEAAGWPPHRDHADADRVTMWVALTPASVEDGCISVLPPHVLPARLAGSWKNLITWSRDDVLRVLHAARPLPASPGTVLCWRANVLHWGGYRTSTARPRIAFSMEFTARPSSEAETGVPSIPLAGPLPDLAFRVRLAASMIRLYHRQDVRLARYLELAHRLIATAPAARVG